MRVKLTEEEKKARQSEYMKAWRLANKDRTQNTSKAYREKNGDKIKAYLRSYNKANKHKKQAWRCANKNKEAAYCKAYRAKSTEKRKAQQRAYYAKNIEKVASRKLEYRVKNKERISMISAEYRVKNKERINSREMERYHNHSNFKIAKNIRNRIYIGIKRVRAKKSLKSIDLLGCSVPVLISHIESLFLPGMTWENHSPDGWHIDHIKPCSSFDLTDPEQQKACFHYTNLQPLWATDNLSKGKKVDWQPQRQSAQL